MSYFADLIDAGLVERPLTLNGRTISTWWRPLTAGQRLELLRGQVVKIDRPDGDDARAVVTEIVLAESAERTQRLVQMTLCTADGKPIYPTLKALQAEPDKLVEALGRIANEVYAEGNG